ncbi:leucine-rich repeat-containing protein let-4-like [Cataglyphis hispanica]|uniref:leucine-rich repeat-containing protein let-4-like n=1 Tax=Cataglyphis hispanica TaxID=1086592 RepID=UPI00217F6E78|nr:leucine-rich repeat-containing protein let-4-like [Cataglyphis hispanica]
MKFDIMKFFFTIIIFVSWSTLTTANESQISLEFPTYNVTDVEHLCKNKIISLNFTDSKIISIGRDFINSPWITCLNLTNTHLQSIEKGAFDKLPLLTQLILSNNNINGNKLFDFGGHETLNILILNNVINNINNLSYTLPKISEAYPNLEILSVSGNYISDLKTSLEKTPFPKLKILDLSNNNIGNTNFVKLLPNSLRFLYLQHNSLISLFFDKKQIDLLTLNLDNNNLSFIKKLTYNYLPNNSHSQQYRKPIIIVPVSNSLVMAGLENLQYLSISANQINNIESNAFEDMNKLVYLNLSRNEISFLDSETFEKLQSLRSLDLSYNKLNDVPEILSETIIRILSLSGNKITKITSNAFIQMPKLTKLLLGENEIEDINVKAFAQLSLLEILDLSKNKLSSLPEEFGKSLTSLKHLNVEGNQFTSLESLSLTSMLSSVEVNVAMNPFKYLNVNYLKTLPQNLTVVLI